MSERQERLESLLQCIYEADVEAGAWASEPEPAILPDSRYDRKLQQLFETFRHGDMPEEFRHVEPLVQSADEAYQSYQQRMQQSNRWELAPPPIVGDMLEAISEKMVQEVFQEKPPLETISQFDKQGVNDRQIAVAYEWYLPNGTPDIARVQRQRMDNPNALFDNPVNARIRAKREEQSNQLQELLEKIRNRSEPQPVEAPETIEDLIGQGVSGKQICQMKQITMSQLERYCHNHGLPMPTESSSIEEAALEAETKREKERQEFLYGQDGQDDEPSIDEETDEADDSDGIPMDDTLSIEEQIIKLADESPDLKNSEIAELLDVSAQKVTAALARREQIVG